MSAKKKKKVERSESLPDSKRTVSLEERFTFVSDHNFRISLIALTLFIGFNFYFFFEQISGTKYFWSNYWSDFTEIYIPFIKLNIQAISNGEIPLWNPYAYGGMVHMAETTSLVFYPPLFPFYYLLSPDADLYNFLSLFTIAHFIVLSFGIYLLLREIKISFISSVFSAMVFSFSCAVICRWQFLIVLFCISWMPYIFLFLIRILKSPKFLPRETALAALFLAFSYLGGHPQYFFYNFILFGFVVLAYVIRDHRSGISTAENSLKLAYTAVPFVLSLALIAVQLLPLLELIPNTQRSEISYEFAADGSYQLKQLLGFIHPYVFGYYRGNEPIEFVNYYATEGKVYHYWETAVFFGIIPLLLGIFGAIKFRKEILVRALLVSSLFFFLHALGSHGFLYKILFQLPGFSSFRIPGRTMFYVVFALCILAGMSLDYFLKSRPDKKDNVLLLSITLLILLAAVYISSGATGIPNMSPDLQLKLKAYGMSSLIPIAAFLLSLMLFNKYRNWAFPTAIALLVLSFYELTSINKDYKNSEVDIHTAMQADNQLLELIKPNSGDIFRFAASTGRARVLKRNQATFLGVYSMDGFYGFNLKTRSDLPPNWPVNDLMSVRISSDITGEDIGAPQLKLTPHPTALNHLRMSYDYIVNTDKSIDGANIDFSVQTVLNKEPDINLFNESASPPEYKIEIDEYNFNSQKIKLETNRPGLLVASEYDYPNWKSYLDGKPVETLKANYMNRAVAIPSGVHELAFKFESKAFTWGLFISAIGLVALLALLIIQTLISRLK